MNIFIERSVASLPGPVSGDDIYQLRLLCEDDNGAHQPLNASSSPLPLLMRIEAARRLRARFGVEPSFWAVAVTDFLFLPTLFYACSLWQPVSRSFWRKARSK